MSQLQLPNAAGNLKEGSCVPREKIIKSLLLIEYGLTRKSMALSEKDKQVILN